MGRIITTSLVVRRGSCVVGRSSFVVRRRQHNSLQRSSATEVKLYLFLRICLRRENLIWLTTNDPTTNGQHRLTRPTKLPFSDTLISNRFTPDFISKGLMPC